MKTANPQLCFFFFLNIFVYFLGMKNSQQQNKTAKLPWERVVQGPKEHITTEQVHQSWLLKSYKNGTWCQNFKLVVSKTRMKVSMNASDQLEWLIFTLGP